VDFAGEEVDFLWVAGVIECGFEGVEFAGEEVVGDRPGAVGLGCGVGCRLVRAY